MFESPEALHGLTEAISARLWYPFAAYLFAILIQVFQVWQPRLFEERDGQDPIVPKRLQWAPALVVTGLAAFVEAFYAGLGLPMAVAISAYAVATGGPAVIGAHRIAKELKSSGGLPPSSGALIVLFAVGFGGATLVGCAGANRPVAHHVETGAAMAYTSAVVALELLDAVQAEHIASLEAPTDAQLAEAETLVRRLELARDALAVVECTLVAERCRPPLQPAKDLRGPLRDGLRLLRQAVDTEGVRVPPRAAEALRVAEVWLGGDGAW